VLRTCADDLPPRQASLPGAPGPAAARKRATRAVFFPRPEGRGFYRRPAEQDPCRAFCSMEGCRPRAKSEPAGQWRVIKCPFGSMRSTSDPAASWQGTLAVPRFGS
jgi:hypothetical protein